MERQKVRIKVKWGVIIMIVLTFTSSCSNKKKDNRNDLPTLTFSSSNSENNNDIIKAYCIDYNWNFKGDGAHGFAIPGLWADANPEEHVKWYKDLGCNTIQTFAVSSNGYAWYKNGVVPEQPGLKYDFLTEMVKLGRKNDMKVFGYFCIGANNRWEELHPDQCYQTWGIQIPFTTEYLDYLCASIKDAIIKTDMDGFMIDWLYNPGGGHDPLPALRWLPCEQIMYKELMGEGFPGKHKMNLPLEIEFRKKSIDRAWGRIRDAAKSTKPSCLIWLSANELRSKEYVGTKVLQEVDWIMNEAGDVSRTESTRSLIGDHAKIMTCLASWNQQDPLEVVSHAKKTGVGLYGFTKPVIGNIMKPINYYLSKPVDQYKNDEKNIAVFARAFNGFPDNYVKKE
ncbi:alpha-amylase family protein [Lutibacter citreus]|uniref:hypothetical protein n=1 Tax=Lutibacter citreus TaxID=2138210 RepID=UPI000DBE5892|nr:hypothetical protein [Lutibacter citreus]